MRRLLEELSNLPINGLVAKGFKKVQRIDIAAAKSTNLKGGVKKEIRNAAQFLHVALDTIRNRTASSGEDQHESERLREENTHLRRELEEIRRREEERTRMPPPSSPLLETITGGLDD